MTFADIIREAGHSPKEFPNASQIPVKLYDRKDRLVQSESIQFVEPLFAYNEQSKLAFHGLLNDLEKNPLTEITVRIDENIVVVFYKTPNARIFTRQPHST